MNDFNAGDESHVNERRKKEKSGRDQELEDIRHVLATRQGRRFYWRYLSECGVFRTSFVTNATIYFNEGRRSIGLHLMADMNEAAPESFVLMQKEAKDG